MRNTQNFWALRAPLNIPFRVWLCPDPGSEGVYSAILLFDISRSGVVAFASLLPNHHPPTVCQIYCSQLVGVRR